MIEPAASSLAGQRITNDATEAGKVELAMADVHENLANTGDISSVFSLGSRFYSGGQNI